MSGDGGSLRDYFMRQIRADLEQQKSERCCSRGVKREHCIDHRDNESEQA